jgi:hypothetical protein
LTEYALVEIAAGAAFVFDDHSAADPLLQRRRHDPRDNIGWTSGRVGDHDPHRALGISGKRRTDAQHIRRRDRAQHRGTDGLDDASP